MWNGLSQFEKDKYYNNSLDLLLTDINLIHTFKLSTINNFDILNLWYTKKVSDELEFDIERYYNVSFDILSKSHIFIKLKYGEYHFTLTNPDQTLVVSYQVTYKDVFNALLHMYCNGGVLI